MTRLRLLLLTLLVADTCSAENGPLFRGRRLFGRPRLARGSSHEDNNDKHDSDATPQPHAITASSSSSSSSIAEYVAAVEKRDAQEDEAETENNDENELHMNNRRGDTADYDSSSERPHHLTSSNQASPGDVDEGSVNHNNHSGSLSSSSSREGGGSTQTTPDSAEPAAVGVKAHKKSGSVGDADSDDDDDDDDDEDDDDDGDSTDSDWEEFKVNSNEMDSMLMAPTQLEVEVEFVQDESDEHNNDDTTAKEDDSALSTVGTGGGVGVIRRQQHHQHHNSHSQRTRSVATTAATLSQSPVKEQEMMEAWLPHVYFPPGKTAMEYLSNNARMLDGASKSRLDRRTLYACLLMEWMHANATYRKFLEKSTSQGLQAALALATQPQWRQCSSQRLCGIRLYDDSETERGCTLAMQETIVMALAHSLGAGVVVLDDSILSTVRRDLLAKGYAEEDVKPTVLMQWLLEVAREGKLVATTTTTKSGVATGSLSRCMKEDLHNGLDDPYDERALSSWHEMTEWEKIWNDQPLEKETDTAELPLVIFVRAESSKSLLKSKSAVELLLQEANSDEGINLVVVGKGVDANTEALPDEGVSELTETSTELQPRGPPSGAPWFGFSPQNQNASGQNDPEGSRRFNIFLSRTVDAEGSPGILGAIAPPQAGNLFPHMMAMQAHERLRNQGEDSPVRAELERWAQILQQQQQMNTNSGSSMPPPQFFNASLSGPFDNSDQPHAPPPSPEILQQTLQAAMSELLDRLAQMSEEENSSDETANLHKAFAQVLRNENLRRGITENLARAAPALSDPKCQGVMLSVYVPPPPAFMNRGSTPNQKNSKPANSMNGWFQRILNNQEEANNAAENQGDISDEERQHSKSRRVRTMAAAAAVAAASQAQASKDSTGEVEKVDKYERNLARLESVCRPILVESPSDPVRGKSWESWIARERGSVVFRLNRQALNDALDGHSVAIQDHTGTHSAGSALRGMLSVRDITDNMDEIVQCAIEIEAQKSQILRVTPEEMHENERDLEIDVSLSQLLVSEDGTTSETSLSARFLHPSSIESAINTVCRISPSPSGGLSVSSVDPSHRSKEEIAALAQDKHERALISQVVSPQDIGVTYDMIGGLSEVKELLRQSITYPLKFPHLYSEGIAREAVKGVLLFGPPGTGKTMLAKALASEGGASFLSVDASSIENKWLGESEKNAKAVFTLARRLAPCVVFIDEVDSLLSSREGTSDDSAHGTLTSVKTTMMSEWDGLNSGTNGVGEAGSDRVVVIGSTNRPFDLDEAVLRRFPRRILVDLPDLQTRKEILEVTLAENRLDPSVNLTSVAERLEGYTGSDIKEVCREAVVRISHEQAKLLDQGFADTREDQTKGSLQRLRPVTMTDFEDALTKLKRSVSEKGRELARVWEWNDEYGEIKKEKKNHLPQLANMYL